MSCQMSKYFGKCFGPSTPAPKSSFWLRCPSFLLSKFASQWKLIQSVSGSWSQDSGSQSRNFQVPGTYFQVPGCQGPRVPGSRVPKSRVSGFQGPGSQSPGRQGPGVPGLRSQGPRSRVSRHDFRLCQKIYQHLWVL